MRTSAQILHIFLRIALFFTLIVGGLLLGIAFFLRQNPTALAEHLANAVRSRAGIECSMGLVDVAMLPMPALAVADIRISTEDMSLSVAYATLRPSLTALLRGTFEPGEITLLRPEIVFKTPAEKPTPPADGADARPASATPPPSFALPALLRNCRLVVHHGKVDGLQLGDRRLRLSDIRTDITPGFNEDADQLQGWLHVGSATVYDGDAVAAQLDAVQIDMDAVGPDAGKNFGPGMEFSGRIRVQGRAMLPHVLHVKNFDILVEQNRRKADSSSLLTATLLGDFPFDGQNIPFHVRGLGKSPSKDKNTGKDSLTIDSLDIMLDRDRLHMQGQARLPSGDSLWPEVQGTLTLHRLSLTQWFGFGRPMPGGLQHSLDNLSGELRFSLDATGLKVPHLQVRVAGTSFEGQGGVSSWAKPVIAIDARSRQLNLGTALPEAVGTFPAPPSFRHKALTPEPGSSAAANSGLPDINYDIQLAVDTLHYGPLQMQNVRYRCLPAVMKGQAGQGIVDMRFAAGSLYGGTADGALLLTSGNATRPTQYDIRAQLKNVNAEKPLHLLTGSRWLGGRLSATAQWRAEGKQSSVFFATLTGTSAIKVEEGYCDSPTQPGDADKFAFSRLELNSRHQGQPSTGNTRASQANTMLFDGEWQALLHTKDWQGSLRLDGPLHLSAKGGLPLTFQKLPGSVSLHANKELTGLPNAVKGHATGRFSYNSASTNLEIEDALVSSEGLEVRGALQSNLKNLTLKGDIQLKSTQLRRSLAAFGQTLPSLPPTALQQIKGSARLACSPTAFNLHNLKTTIDATHIAGSLEGDWSGRAAWKFDLNADAIDSVLYRIPLPPSKGSEIPKPSTTPWNLGILQRTDAQGTLRVGTLRLFKLHLQNVHIPVRLHKGILECAPLKAHFYTAPTQGSLRAEAKDGLKLRLELQATNVDMLPLTSDLGLGTVLSGRARFTSSTAGLMKSDADVPAALNGTYGLEILNGYFQSRSPKGESKGGKTGFNFLRGSGQLLNGILYNSDFVMDSSSMRVSGKGNINFVTRQLDYTAQVNMRNIAEFPVHYYGPLNNPQREIKAGKAIVDTLGQLGADVFGLVGDVISVPFKFLR